MDFSTFCLCAVSFLLGMITFFFFIVWSFRDEDAIRNQALEKGFAEYNSKTGEWQWKETEEKK